MFRDGEVPVGLRTKCLYMLQKEGNVLYMNRLDEKEEKENATKANSDVKLEETADALVRFLSKRYPISMKILRRVFGQDGD